MKFSSRFHFSSFFHFHMTDSCIALVDCCKKLFKMFPGREEVYCWLDSGAGPWRRNGEFIFPAIRQFHCPLYKTKFEKWHRSALHYISLVLCLVICSRHRSELYSCTTRRDSGLHTLSVYHRFIEEAFFLFSLDTYYKTQQKNSRAEMTSRNASKGNYSITSAATTPQTQSAVKTQSLSSSSEHGIVIGNLLGDARLSAAVWCLFLVMTGVMVWHNVVLATWGIGTFPSITRWNMERISLVIYAWLFFADDAAIELCKIHSYYSHILDIGYTPG